MSFLPVATRQSGAFAVAFNPRSKCTTARLVTANAEKKLVIITGANTGIGFETAKSLGRKDYHVVLACRDEARAAAALAALQADNSSGSFEVQKLVLDDLSNVKDFVKATLDKGRPIDVLINNAGVMACPEMQTKDGYEYQLGVNHIGHFALTTGLLPLMTDPDREQRIVTVASSAHLFGTINFNDINNRKNYSPWLVYGQSKLANILFAFELSKRLPFTANLTSNALHPGVVDTELARYLTAGQSIFDIPFVKSIVSTFLKTPPQGAETSIYLASSPEARGVTSKYFDNCKPITPKYDVFDEELRRKFWDLSCEMAGVDGDVAAAVKSNAKVVA